MLDSLPEALINRALKGAIALSALSLLGFGAFYYIDRYHPAAAQVEDQLLRQLEAQVIQDPQNPGARVRVAWAYLDQKMVEQALIQFDEALKLREDYQAALIGKGTAYVRKGSLNAALPPLERVAELNQENFFRKTLRELQPVYYHLGTIYAAQGRGEKAIGAFKEALEIDRVDADSLYGLAMVYLAQGDLEQARPNLELAVRLDPVFADGHRALAGIYERLGMAGNSLLARAMVSYSEARYDEALGLLDQARALAPEVGEVDQALGLVYDKKGQPAEAVAAYRTALAKDPQLALAQGAVARARP